MGLFFNKPIYLIFRFKVRYIPFPTYRLFQKSLCTNKEIPQTGYWPLFKTYLWQVVTILKS